MRESSLLSQSQGPRTFPSGAVCDLVSLGKLPQDGKCSEKTTLCPSSAELE